jgi:Peptidase propeptide and YPEB domain
MSTIKSLLPGLILAAGMLLPGHVLADRAPTPQERSRIETMLRNEGFTRWGRIEMDDDDYLWEVDDARASDGRTYDLQLHPDTLSIIGREPADD